MFFWKNPTCEEIELSDEMMTFDCCRFLVSHSPSALDELASIFINQRKTVVTARYDGYTIR